MAFCHNRMKRLMFDNLTDRLTHALRQATGGGRLNEDNIKDTLREVRMALLEADVALPVVKDFVDHIRSAALGQEIMKSLAPGQAFVKIVHDELVRLMGEAHAGLDFTATPPAVVLMAGLQGAGKTTTVAKLARHLKERKKSVMVVSVDVYRPAAILQLQTLAREVDVAFFPAQNDQDPLNIARAAVQAARVQAVDVLIVDTAGRLHIDVEMMDEIQALHAALKPTETLFVVDAMTGQDAANTAQAFNAALPLTGVILTKVDGDARGGAALSVRAITGKPIKFLGAGEKSDALEAFHPERMASRILGMGDVLTLVEEAERKLDKEKAEKLAKKLKKGKGFDLQDMLDQFEQMDALGGPMGMLDKLPGVNASMLQQLQSDQGPQKAMRQTRAIIQSMTMVERRRPDLINGSRKRRIAQGSGMQIQDVNRVLKQHAQMEKMMKKIASPGGMLKMMRGMQQGGGLPGLAGGAAMPGGLPGLKMPLLPGAKGPGGGR